MAFKLGQSFNFILSRWSETKWETGLAQWLIPRAALKATSPLSKMTFYGEAATPCQLSIASVLSDGSSRHFSKGALMCFCNLCFCVKYAAAYLANISTRDYRAASYDNLKTEAEEIHRVLSESDKN